MIKGDRLRKIRQEKGLTLEQLAEMVGVCKASISFYEKEKRNPSLDTIIEFMQIFGVSADYLLGSENIIKVVEDEEISYSLLTNEDIKFIEELKKNKMVYNILIQDPKRGAELVKNKIG